ncbi:Hsp20/alpha crystallin family protein [Microcoleus sp. FACHB-1515]|uniref:Hsp20/alpha crystallin family protein n=1 Tax=Cyanophyceae TaxID=3028117 RepID=UPI001682217F|nr:Hsp20/alpha crystallin family protein [Microcoleus sp. FACHB-1515]MBD2090108.1 Hsp20/alpha crystallin family protein [Microcoleus sp. FACHB-1515]
MLVRYWQPLREMETLRRQFDRVFDELSFATNESAWSPAIELRDMGDAIELRAQLPGLDAKDIDIQVSREAVAIVGEYRQASQSENNLLNSEFRYGKFQRVITLPVAVINDQVKADYKDGILTLTLPKVTEARNTVVKLNLAELSHSNSTPEIAAQEQAAHN